MKRSIRMWWWIAMICVAAVVLLDIAEHFWPTHLLDQAGKSFAVLGFVSAFSFIQERISRLEKLAERDEDK